MMPGYREKLRSLLWVLAFHPEWEAELFVYCHDPREYVLIGSTSGYGPRVVH